MKLNILFTFVLLAICFTTIAAFGPPPAKDEPVSQCGVCGIKYYPRLTTHNCTEGVVVKQPKKSCNCASCNKKYVAQLQANKKATAGNVKYAEALARQKALGISYSGVKKDFTAKQVNEYIKFRQQQVSYSDSSSAEVLKRIEAQKNSYSPKI